MLTFFKPSAQLETGLFATAASYRAFKSQGVLTQLGRALFLVVAV